MSLRLFRFDELTPFDIRSEDLLIVCALDCCSETGELIGRVVGKVYPVRTLVSGSRRAVDLVELLFNC